jgi:hypothetical protein
LPPLPALVLPPAAFPPLPPDGVPPPAPATLPPGAVVPLRPAAALPPEAIWPLACEPAVEVEPPPEPPLFETSHALATKAAAHTAIEKS